MIKILFIVVLILGFGAGFYLGQRQCKANVAVEE